MTAPYWALGGETVLLRPQLEKWIEDMRRDGCPVPDKGFTSKKQILDFIRAQRLAYWSDHDTLGPAPRHAVQITASDADEWLRTLPPFSEEST